MKANFWSNFDDSELLKCRIRELELDLAGSDILPRVETLFEELRTKGLQFQPRVYFGDEWFSPEGVPAISIPFFLAHPRLRQLERKMMMECEGEDPQDFLKLLRHEAGHAFDHAFKVSRRKLWVKNFGSNKIPYRPEAYRARPYSKGFVQNISNDYAQAHPDEDFAETFAVWLDPQSNWTESYRGWGAQQKLTYVDGLCREMRTRRAPEIKGRLLSEARFLNSTLETYYRRKKKQLEDDFPDFFDSDLLKIFSQRGEVSARAPMASSFMRHHRKKLVGTLAAWTRERKIVINELLSQLVARSRELELVVLKDDQHTLVELVSFLSSLIAHYRITGSFKRLR